MSDTVKLIIEIPKIDKELLDTGLCGETRKEAILYAVKNGIPLDDVKAEIDKAQEPYKSSVAYDEGVRFGLMLAYQIIDKYKVDMRGKAE